jgi:Ca2+-binding RTX toxin-like protein
MAEQYILAISDYGLGVRVEGTGWGETVDGTEHADELSGYGGDDIIRGLGGDDKIAGGAGNDRIEGGSGHDTITATSGVDIVSGGSGNDTITVSGVDNGFRFDRVDGGADNDTINITSGKVIAAGGTGTDTITSGVAGDLVLIGGAGSDRFVITSLRWSSSRLSEIIGGDAQVSLNSFFGVESVGSVTLGVDNAVDTLDLSAVTSTNAFGARIDLAAGTLGNLGLEGVVGQNMPAATISGIENVVGTAFRDTIIGNAVNNDLRGGAGNDTINGGRGDDDLHGDAGNDTISGGDDKDFIRGGDGDDTLSGGNHDDRLFGGDGIDSLSGGEGNDTLMGGRGADTISGGDGIDRIFGEFLGEGASVDTLTGGADADTFVFVNASKTTQVVTVTTPTGSGTFVQDVSVMDKITDFDPQGIDRDMIDLSILFDLKSRTFTGSAQDAIDQGFLRFVQLGGATQVIYDTNGGTHTDTANNFAIVELAGLTPLDLRADHFLV